MRRQFVEDQRNTILKTTPEAGIPLSRSLYLRTVNWNIGYNPSCFSAWRNQIDVPPHSKTNWVFCTQNKHSFFNICNYLGCLRVILILIHAYKPSLAPPNASRSELQTFFSTISFLFFFCAYELPPTQASILNAPRSRGTTYSVQVRVDLFHSGPAEGYSNSNHPSWQWTGSILLSH